jgi:hypothetical protein
MPSQSRAYVNAPLDVKYKLLCWGFDFCLLPVIITTMINQSINDHHNNHELGFRVKYPLLVLLSAQWCACAPMPWLLTGRSSTSQRLTRMQYATRITKWKAKGPPPQHCPCTVEQPVPSRLATSVAQRDLLTHVWTMWVVCCCPCAS